MPDFHWNELISAEHLDAFAAMWPQEREAASAEVRRLLDLVSKPTEHLNETQAFARRLLLGLSGTDRERLTQVESHSDNIDDLLSFSTMTPEETRDAAAQLFERIEHVDPKHLARLRSLSS